MTTQTYDVPTISCEHCQATIEKKVSEVSGVIDVTVDIAGRNATVTGSSDVAAVTAAIEEAGYAVASVSEGDDSA